MRARSGFGLLLLALFLGQGLAQAAQGGVIDQLTAPQVHNTGKRERFAKACPEGGFQSDLGALLRGCLWPLLDGGFRGDEGGSLLPFAQGVAFSTLSYSPSPQDRVHVKAVFSSWEAGGGELDGLLEAVRQRVIAKYYPSTSAAWSTFALQVYLPLLGEDSEAGRRQREALRAKCDSFWRPDLVLRGASLAVKLYPQAPGSPFGVSGLVMVKVEQPFERGTRAFHFIALKEAGGWRMAYGEPAVSTLVAPYWNLYDRLATKVCPLP